MILFTLLNYDHHINVLKHWKFLKNKGLKKFNINSTDLTINEEKDPRGKTFPWDGINDVKVTNLQYGHTQGFNIENDAMLMECASKNEPII